VHGYQGVWEQVEGAEAKGQALVEAEGK